MGTTEVVFMKINYEKLRMIGTDKTQNYGLFR